MAIVPLVALLRLTFGLPGAALGVLLVGLGLVLTGYGCLAREGRQPAWHHHLARPLLASLAMIPVCLALKHFHVLLAVAGGAITYIAMLGGAGRPASYATLEASARAAGTVELRLRDRRSDRADGIRG